MSRQPIMTAVNRVRLAEAAAQAANFYEVLWKERCEESIQGRMEGRRLFGLLPPRTREEAEAHFNRSALDGGAYGGRYLAYAEEMRRARAIRDLAQIEQLGDELLLPEHDIRLIQRFLT